jgi:hypothetical protein
MIEMLLQDLILSPHQLATCDEERSELSHEAATDLTSPYGGGLEHTQHATFQQILSSMILLTAAWSLRMLPHAGLILSN